MMKKGFTLAEVILTLVIVGIAAAMTIPGVINNTNDREYKAKFKEIYAVLDNATNLIKNENGGVIDQSLFTDGVVKNGKMARDLYATKLNVVIHELNVIKLCAQVAPCLQQK